MSLLVNDSFIPEDTINPIESCAHDSLRIYFHYNTRGVVNVHQTRPGIISHHYRECAGGLVVQGGEYSVLAVGAKP